MKKTLLIVFTLFIKLTFVSAQTADEVAGKWQNGHGSEQIQIFKRSDNYFGKVIWLKEPNDASGKPKLDINNPDKNLQSQPIIGLEVLKDFSYRGNGVYRGGEMYDPKTGNTYNCVMRLRNKNILNIRAYYGLSILGRTATWTRVP